MESKSAPGSRPEEDELQRRFEEAARDLELKIRPRRQSERLTVGVAVVAIQPVQSLVEMGEERALAAPPKDDRKVIAELIETFESAHPDDLLATWEPLVTDPFVAVGTNWVGTLDRKAIGKALASAEAAEQMKQYPFHKPRRVEIRDLSVVFVGSAKAIATYRMEEEHANGQVFAGNAGVILMRDPAGAWKVTVYAKHNRFDDFLPVTRPKAKKLAAKKAAKGKAAKARKPAPAKQAAGSASKPSRAKKTARSTKAGSTRARPARKK